VGNSYARGLLFRRLSDLSQLTITADTVTITAIESVKHKAGNTKIILTAKNVNFFKGQKIYYYDRHVLPVPKDVLYVPLEGRRVAWTWELLELIYAATGIRHLKEEIVNERIKDPNKVTITFSNDHPYWLGGFCISLTDKPKVCVVPSPLNAETAQNANTLFDNIVFTKHADVLKTYSVGDTALDALCEVLNDVNEIGWCYKECSQHYNLMGSRVLYNGPANKVAAAKYPTRKLLRIALNKTTCSRYYGELMLYY